MPTLHIIIPAYNEAATIEACLQRVTAAELPAGWVMSITIVDDCSTDGTGDQVERIIHDSETLPCAMTLLRHDVNRGKGASLQTGFDAVLANPPTNGEQSADDIVIIQDADLEYDPADYASLMQPLIEDAADAVFGTRWGAHFATDGAWRRLHAFGNRSLTMLSNLLTGYRISDMECCYKLMPVTWLRRIRPSLSEERFGIEPQIAAALGRCNARLVERPVSYSPRDVGSGKKIGWRDAARAVWVIGRERFRSTPGSMRGSARRSTYESNTP
ncbi:MAG: glycosyltransferase family 2 protein [Phycisphaerales bacterium]